MEFMAVDLSGQVLTAAVQLLIVILLAALTFIGRAVYLHLRDIFGAGKLEALIECLHRIAHSLEQHVEDHELHQHIGKSAPSRVARASRSKP